MKTGIVFKIEDHKAIILKSDGTFESVHAKSGWQVGETVSIATQSYRKPLLAAAACFILVILGGFGWNQLYRAPVSLISLDVNPSIELGVNRWNRIVSANGLNEEGSQILSEINTKNAVYQDALSDILNAESAGGYFTADANVVLTVYSSDSAIQTALLSELQNLIDAKMELYANQITAEYHAVDENTVTGAHRHGVTAGKYLYLQELQELAPKTDLSQYTHHSIEQIKGEIKSCQTKHKGKTGSSHGEAHGKEKKCN